MTPRKPQPTRDALLRHVRPSDLQAAVRLAAQATMQGYKYWPDDELNGTR